ncbi:MAG: hypothetical protein AAGM84_10175 [Pseudomonadota bacterium]
MSDLTVTPIGIKGGIWSAMVTGDAAGVPQITASHENRAIADVKVTDRGADGWLLQIPIPTDAIADGVQTFIVSDSASGDQLASFALLAGEVLGSDIRAEMDLLRAELDMLKRAFRRHCVETAS